MDVGERERERKGETRRVESRESRGEELGQLASPVTVSSSSRSSVSLVTFPSSVLHTHTAAASAHCLLLLVLLVLVLVMWV